MAEYDYATEFVLVLVKYDRVTIHRLPLRTPDEIDREIRKPDMKANVAERQRRLACTDFWGRDFRLAAPHTFEWL